MVELCLLIRWNTCSGSIALFLSPKLNRNCLFFSPGYISFIFALRTRLLMYVYMYVCDALLSCLHHCAITFIPVLVLIFRGAQSWIKEGAFSSNMYRQHTNLVSSSCGCFQLFFQKVMCLAQRFSASVSTTLQLPPRIGSSITWFGFILADCIPFASCGGIHLIKL